MSSGIAALVAHIAFWTLLGSGWRSANCARAAAVLASLWIAGFVAVQALPAGRPFFAPVVAVLAIVLVFAIFKGDVRLKP